MKRSGKSGGTARTDIRGVAAHAKVSIATVSRTINRVPTVDPVLAARVWKAVSELNYSPNPQARALVSGESKLLGLIVSEITNPFFPELIQEFEQVAVARGYEILIGSTNYETRTMEVCARRMLERKVDGVAIMTFGFEGFLLDRFAEQDIPVVGVDINHKQSSEQTGEAGEIDQAHQTILVDYRAGIHEAVQHLAVLGHRKIAFISGPLRLRPAENRKAAFIDSMRLTGLSVDPSWLIEGTHTLDGGRDAMQTILDLKQWPTAIMCSNDMTAIGVQHALFEADLKIPDDFSLIGFDDIHLAEYTIPPLTTVRMSCKDLANAAVSRLLPNVQRTDGQPRAELDARVPTRLVVRRTTGLPRGSLSDLAPAAPTPKSQR
jgi:DNA-binding LacI/PurR family transcriptional regulator